MRSAYQDCEVPEENRLGNEGEGFKLAETWLVHARIPYAAAVIGIAQAALQLAVEWARERETFGSGFADKQAIQWMIADSEIELRAARLLVYQAAWKGDLGRDIKVDASIARCTRPRWRAGSSTVASRCSAVSASPGCRWSAGIANAHQAHRRRPFGSAPDGDARELLGGQRTKA